LGVGCAIAYYTNASRGLSAIAEFIVTFNRRRRVDFEVRL